MAPSEATPSESVRTSLIFQRADIMLSTLGTLLPISLLALLALSFQFSSFVILGLSNVTNDTGHSSYILDRSYQDTWIMFDNFSNKEDFQWLFFHYSTFIRSLILLLLVVYLRFFICFVKWCWRRIWTVRTLSLAFWSKSFQRCLAVQLELSKDIEDLFQKTWTMQVLELNYPWIPTINLGHIIYHK